MSVCAHTLMYSKFKVCFSVCAGPLMVIVEYCRFGNLSTFLKSKRDVFVHNTVSLPTWFTDGVSITIFCVIQSSHMPVFPILKLLAVVYRTNTVTKSYTQKLTSAIS